MVEQQLKLTPQRDMLLFWGVRDERDFYELEWLEAWASQDPHLRITLAAEHGFDAYGVPVGIATVTGTVAYAIRSSQAPLAHRDAYLAGPPVMLGVVVAELRKAGISPESIHVDAFGGT